MGPFGSGSEPGTNVRAKSGLNRALLDAEPGLFGKCVEDKAASAGFRVVKFEAQDTSRLCSTCGTIVPKTLSERAHRCLGMEKAPVGRPQDRWTDDGSKTKI